MDCEFVTCYDPTISAGYFSQFTGVLAGFAFVAIVFIAEREGVLPGVGNALEADAGTNLHHGDVTSLGPTAYSFLCSFLNLVISTFLFAVTSGEELSIRSFSAFSIAAMAFAVSAISLLASLLHLFEHLRISPLARLARVVVLAAPILAFGYAARTALDVRPVAVGDLDERAVALEVAVVASCFFLIIVSGILLALRRHFKPANLPRMNRLVQAGAVLLCLILAAANGVLSFRGGDYEPPTAALALGVILAAAYFAFTSFVMALTVGDE